MPLRCDYSSDVSEPSVWMSSSSHLSSGTSYQGTWVNLHSILFCPLAVSLADALIASLSSDAPCQVPHEHPPWPTWALKLDTKLPLLPLVWIPSSSHLISVLISWARLPVLLPDTDLSQPVQAWQPVLTEAVFKEDYPKAMQMTQTCLHVYPNSVLPVASLIRLESMIVPVDWSSHE